jgi:BirA family transcriptional regulator, biotin operon repressor / biotin---[acetyl-CoA-carboxylase] ligase
MTKIYDFELLPSTNTKAWELLESGETSPFVVTASQQSAGRGQWGREWISEIGGLYLSLALNLDLTADKSSHLVLATAWGIAHHLNSQDIPVKIKWPNDLVLLGRKLAGIKIETRIQGEKLRQAVIGVGINWSNPVPATGINLQAFAADKITSIAQLTDLTIEAILYGYEYYCNHGIKALLAAYLELFANFGQRIAIEGCQGRITGVSDRGELKVKLASDTASTEICLPVGAISLGYNQI